MLEDDQKKPEKKREEALPERLLRRILEGMGEVVDRKLGRAGELAGALTTTRLIERMKRLIDERARDEGPKGRIAPHLLKLRIEWGTHSEAPQEIIDELEREVLVAAIDHINDQRYRTLAPVRIESEIDLFVTGVSVDPTFGEFEEELGKEDEARRRAAELGTPVIPRGKLHTPDVKVLARVSFPRGPKEINLIFTPGGKRLSVGRASDNDLRLDDGSVSKIHAAMVMDRDGKLLVSDTGSTNGTYLNGRRIVYGEARGVEDGDVVSFGDLEVRFRRTVS